MGKKPKYIMLGLYNSSCHIWIYFSKPEKQLIIFYVILMAKKYYKFLGKSLYLFFLLILFIPCRIKATMCPLPSLFFFSCHLGLLQQTDLPDPLFCNTPCLHMTVTFPKLLFLLSCVPPSFDQKILRILLRHLQ